MTKSAPLLSIITICFNDLDGLKKTHQSIFSVLSSSYRSAIEWVVIDGGSTDGTRQFLEVNCDVDCYLSEPDGGVYDAMNKGSAIASGTFYVYMNSGDIFLDINEIISLINENESAELLFFNSVFDYGSYIRTRRARSFHYIKHSIPANHQAIVFRQECLPSPPYDTSFKICGDYHLLANLYIQQTKHLVLPVSMARFAVGGASTMKWRLLLSEALLVQSQLLKLNMPWRVYSYARRYFNVLATYIIHRFSGAGKCKT